MFGLGLMQRRIQSSTRLVLPFFLVSVGFASPAYGDLQVQLLQSQYLSEVQNSSQTNSYSSFAARLDQKWGSLDNWSSKLEMISLGSVDGSEQVYFAGPEAYVEKASDLSQGLRVTLGRKRLKWSEFDQEWRLGIWQPYVRWDYLHPHDQGLIGAFLGYGRNLTQVTAFASPVFLPDQGPHFETKNGEFHSSNRWFRQPQNRHLILDQERRLNYELDRPSTDATVFHPSFGLNILVGPQTDGFYLRTSFADKPINQIHLGIEGYHSLARTDRFLESIAKVHPMVARHTVTSVEAGWENDDAHAYISLTEEHPHHPSVPAEWEESSLYDSRFFGLSFAHRLPFEGFRGHWIKAGFMNLSEIIPPSSLGVPEDNLESSLDRYPYQQVLSFEWTARFQEKISRDVSMSLRYLYSIPERGSLLSVKVEYLVERRLRWDLGVDVLGAEISPDDENSGLMSLYRNNDRVIGGVTYVF